MKKKVFESDEDIVIFIKKILEWYSRERKRERDRAKLTRGEEMGGRKSLDLRNSDFPKELGRSLVRKWRWYNLRYEVWLKEFK